MAGSGDVEKLILRFRDLGIPQGETIRRHSEIIFSSSYVWWGWWSKQGEAVPLNVFAELNERIDREQNIELFLYDSGTSSLYKASCVKIEFSGTKGKRIPSPGTSEGTTPEYYGEVEQPAWFKFSSIELVEEDLHTVLNQYSYVDVRDFFMGPEYHILLAEYHDKVVSSIRELKNQERTIWFIRSFRSGDLTTELLTQAPVQARKDFLSDFKSGNRKSFLWLSDLHFGSPVGERYPQEREGNKRPFWIAVEEARSKLNLDVAGLIISGDITTHARSEGYDVAKNLIAELNTKIRLDNSDYVICPGNHDFGFNIDPLTPGSEISTVDAVSTETYSRFYNDVFKNTPNKYFACGRRYLLENLHPIEIVTINSVMLQQTGGEFQGNGFVGNDQLAYVAEQYGWGTTEKSRPTRILVMHHNLFPVQYTEATTAHSRYSTTLDAEAIIRWALEHGVDLILHGHQHQPNVVQLRRPTKLDPKTPSSEEAWPSLTVCGLGSSGAEPSDLGDPNANTMGVITLDGKKLNLKVYKIDPVIPTDEGSLVFDVTVASNRRN